MKSSIKSRIAFSLLMAAALATVCSNVQAALTFTVSSSGWPNETHRNAAVNAMQSAVNRYDAYGNFGNHDVWVYYNSGIPTAQASYLGSIGFGGTYPNERVAMHELAHYLGSGTYGTPWNGARSNALVRQFDGLQVSLNGDAQHFWPYGLNFDSEGSEINKQRHVAIIYAQRADMGIGSTGNPSSWAATVVTLKASDSLGTSGFNYATNWSDNAFAHPNSDYFTGDFYLRTPASGNSFTFVGKSVTVNNTNGTGGGLLYKGTGTTGITTINNLILDGGYVRHANGAGDLFQLAGDVTLVGTSTIDAAQGHIKILAPIAGSGSLIKTGPYTVTLTGNNTYSGSTSVTAGRLVLSNAGLPNTAGVTVSTGAILAARGSIGGPLTALSGSVIQVGDDGVSVPRRFLIDSFETYATGNVRSVANPPWTAHGAGSGTQFANIEDHSGNKVLTYGWWNGSRGTSRDMPENGVIDGDKTATFFFRFNSKTDQPDHNFGLADHVTTSSDANFNEYQAQFRIAPGTASGSFAVQARNGGAFTPNLATGLAPHTWYNVWMVVDQATDTYDVYMNTGAAAATAAHKLNANPLAFRNDMSISLNKILALAAPAPIDYGVRIDDLYFQHGLDLSNPLAGLVPELFLDAATVTVQGNFTLNTGATLKLDIFEPSIVDLLNVQGTFMAGGTLDVTLVPGAPSPQIGNTFNILNFASAGGVFTALNLPALSAGLAWNTSNLLTTGILEVVLAGDHNGDGAVDAADYVLWRKTNVHGQQGYDAWRAHYGTVAGSGANVGLAAVPEPASPVLLVLGIAMPWRRSR